MDQLDLLVLRDHQVFKDLKAHQVSKVILVTLGLLGLMVQLEIQVHLALLGPVDRLAQEGILEVQAT